MVKRRSPEPGAGSMASPHIVVCPDPEALVREAAHYFVRMAREAISARGRFTVALAGGATPRPLYEMLASPSWREQIDWSHVHIFWGDERLVPADHVESNYQMVNLALLAKVPVLAANVHPVPTELGDPQAVAVAYERTIRQDFAANTEDVPRLDLSLLGLGANGHTASLFPHSRSLGELRTLVADSFIPELGQHRISMTLPLINQSRHILFLVSGAAKSVVVNEVIFGQNDPQRLPAQLIRPVAGTLTWMLDQAAAARLPRIRDRA